MNGPPFLDQGEYEEWKAQPRIGIYIPTLGRPHALQRVVDNIAASTVTPCRVVFVTEKTDLDSTLAAEATGAAVMVNEYDGSYSNSIQTAYERDDSPGFIAANDDFDFQPGWDVAARETMREGAQVVGIHDGYQGCQFTTICLVDRRYIVEQSGVIDIPNRVQYPYRHNYGDTEFHATAVRRGVFRACPGSMILHRHPDFGHAEQDTTYRKSQATAGEDAVTFASRAHLWA